MGRTPIPFKEKKSRLATSIEIWFKKHLDVDLHFGQILEQYCTVGQSVESVAERLEDITDNQIRIPRSTLAYAIRLLINQKKTKFRIKAKFPGNEFRRIGSGRHTKIGTSILQKSIERVHFYCDVCKNNYQTIIKIDPYGFTGLDGYVCENCGSIGQGHFIITGKTRLMKVSLINGPIKDSKVEHISIIKKGDIHETKTANS